MPQNKESIYTVGGTVQAGEGLYIPRRADREMLRHCESGDFVYVLAARQLGKSSLMVRTAAQLREIGKETAVIDLTELGVQATAAEWYLGLMLKIGSELGLNTDIFSWWLNHEHVGLTQRLVQFLGDVVLASLSNDIVIFIDEIDSTLSLDFTDDFFAAIRYLYNARSIEAKFSRLSFVLIGVATPGDLISDAKRTPFNIGERVELSDFTFAEAAPLASGLTDDPVHAQEVLSMIWQWTAGHPYLTQRLCQAVSLSSFQNWSKREISDLVEQMFLGDMSRSDSNLQFVNDMLTKRAPDRERILKTYRSIRLGWQAVPDEEHSLAKTHLKLSGIVCSDKGVLHVRNAIYEQVFDRHWLHAHWPQNWWQTLPLAIKFTSIIIVILLIALTITTILATKNAALANERTSLADSHTLLAQSELLLDSQYDLSLLLGLVAKNMSDSVESEDYLRYALAYNPYLVRYLWEHEAPVTQVAFSPNGRFLATADELGTLFLRDGDTGEVKAGPLSAHASPVRSLAFTPDNTQLATGGCGQYDTETKLCQQGEIHLWDLVQEPAISKTLAAHQDKVLTLTFNVTGDLLASASNSDLIIWDTKTWQQIWNSKNTQLIGPEFHPYDPEILAYGTANGNIQILDVTTGTILKDLQAHQDLIYDVSFSPDGRLLAAASKDGQISLWYVETWEFVRSLTEHTDQVVTVEFSPDSNHLISTGLDGQMFFWDLSSEAKRPLQLSGHQGQAHYTAFQPDNDHFRLVSNGPENSVIVWNLDGDPARRMTLSNHTGAVLGLAFSPDGTVLASGGADARIFLWDVSTGKSIGQPLIGHTDVVRRVEFSPTGQYLASASRDHKIFLWDLHEDHLQPTELIKHTTIVRDIAFNYDGTLLASSDDEGLILLWNGQTGQLKSVLANEHSEVFDIEFSPTGDLLAAGYWDGTIRFWDTHLSQQIGSGIDSGLEQIWALSFDPKRNLLAVAGSSGKIVFIQVEQQRIISELITGHTNRINTLAFSPDGSFLVTGGSDNKMKLWRMPEQKDIGQSFVIHPSAITSVEFDPKGVTLASGDNFGNIYLSNIQYLSMADTICNIVDRNLTITEWQQYVGNTYEYKTICQEKP